MSHERVAALAAGGCYSPRQMHDRLAWLRRWHIAVNLGLLAMGVILGFTWSPRAFLLLPMVPLAFVPFSYARLRLERFLARHFAAPRLLLGLTAAAVALDTFMLVQMLTVRTLPIDVLVRDPILGWVGPVWYSSFAILAVAFAIAHVLKLPLRRWRRRREVVPVDVGRRQFLRQAGVLGAGAPFVASVSGANLSYDFRVDEHEVRLPNWPRGLDGLRLAHLSDIHVGGAMDRARLLHVAALTQRARPDLVVHTGDFLTHRDGDFDAPLYEALARIEAPHGQWACLGNHDFDDAPRLVRRLYAAGVRTLRDRVTTLFIDGHEIELAGLDYTFGRGQRGASMARRIASWGERRPVPRLLLNHDPTSFAALRDGCADLVFSGHTHGGQIGLQFAPQRALTVVGLVGLPDQGVFRRGSMQLFVTRCVGFYGYPMRLGIPPEISIVRLRRA